MKYSFCNFRALQEQNRERAQQYQQCSKVYHLRQPSLLVLCAYDHKHRHIADKGVPYEFKDAYQLLSDFFADVDRILKDTEK